MSENKPSIAILGYGKMGQALAQGVLRSKVTRRLMAYDVLPERIKAMKDDGVEPTRNNLEAVRSSDVVVIAVKPAQVASLLRELASDVKDQLLISIAAGVRLHHLESILPSARLIRAMPNIAAMVGEAITALAPGRLSTKKDVETAMLIFSSIGKCRIIDEDLMDIVTGLSASGLAYVFLVIEALADGALMMGMPHDIALEFSAQTVLGAARLVLAKGTHPAELKKLVATPAGTTIAGLYELERSKVRAALMKAVKMASKRARELAEGLP